MSIAAEKFQYLLCKSKETNAIKVNLKSVSLFSRVSKSLRFECASSYIHFHEGSKENFNEIQTLDIKLAKLHYNKVVKLHMRNKK